MGDLPGASQHCFTFVHNHLVLCLLCTEQNSHFLAQLHLLSEMQLLVQGSSVPFFVCSKHVTSVRLVPLSAPFLAISLPLC